MLIYFLKEDEQLYIEGFTRRWTVKGPGRVIISPLNRVRRQKGITLEPTQYLHVRNTLTGELKAVHGPQLYFLDVNEQVVEKKDVIPLKNNQYVRLIDRSSGVQRVERGEKSVYLSPTEEIVGKVTEGVNVDEATAVLVRDTTTGQLDLITEPQLYIPSFTQEIVETRARIRLEDHETVVIKDRTGQYEFRRGTDENRSFFLEPHTELVVLRWSAGLHKDARSLRITNIDARPKFMWYEFEARTQDNVELIIGITFFWQIIDVLLMVRRTDDAPGDICSHARSMIIQAVSQVTLERFLAEFNSIVRSVILDTGDTFYSERGATLHAVEVRSIACKDPGTQEILQKIIQETTNRINRLQQQESENEVRVKRMQGEIEAEEMRGQLIDLQHDHARAEGSTQGAAEAERVHAFLDGLGDLSAEQKMALFTLLRKQDIFGALSQGKANLYFTPEDIDLSSITLGSGGG